MIEQQAKQPALTMRHWCIAPSRQPTNVHVNMSARLAAHGNKRK